MAQAVGAGGTALAERESVTTHNESLPRVDPEPLEDHLV